MASVTVLKLLIISSTAGSRSDVVSSMGSHRQVQDSSRFSSVSTVRSNRPMTPEPQPAWTMGIPFTTSASSMKVWEWPPMIRSTPQEGSSRAASFRSSPSPMWVSRTVRSMSAAR